MQKQTISLIHIIHTKPLMAQCQLTQLQIHLLFDRHPEIEVKKKTKSPDEDKSVHDAKLLIPSLMDFFSAHPLINPKSFR